MTMYIIEVILKKKYWRMKAGNGEILAHSETFKRLQSTVKIAKKVAKGINGKYKEI